MSFPCALPTGGCLVMLLFLLSLRMSGIAWVEDVNGADCLFKCVEWALRSKFPRGLQVRVRYITVGLGGKPNVITSDC